MNKFEKQRGQILADMQKIKHMQRGHLTEEYQERVVDGQKKRLGPYYKYQVWKEGKNQSRRIAADQAPQLQKGIEGLGQFKELCEEYINVTIAMNEAEGLEERKGKKTPDHNR